MIRVLVISNLYPNDHKPYAGIYVHRHVLLHRQQGLDVKVITPSGNQRGRINRLWNYLLMLFPAVRTLLFWNFDIIHAHWIFPSGLLGTFISYVKKRPLVVTSHGAHIDDYETRSFLLRPLIKPVLHHADVIFAVGLNHKQRIETIAGISSDRVKYLPMGILTSERLSKNEARASLNLDRESSLLIFMGNLDRFKGPDILIRAVAEIQNKIKSLNVLICGQGSEYSNLCRMISELELQQVIHLVGGVPPESVSCWLSAADLCIIPSRRESFGLVALEAMACGTPVIAAQVGGLGENIIHGHNGFLFPKEDHLKLAEQIEQALQDKPLREAIALNGIQTAAKFDMVSQAEKVRQIYIELTSPEQILA